MPNWEFWWKLFCSLSGATDEFSCLLAPWWLHLLLLGMHFVFQEHKLKRGCLFLLENPTQRPLWHLRCPCHSSRGGARGALMLGAAPNTTTRHFTFCSLRSQWQHFHRIWFQSRLGVSCHKWRPDIALNSDNILHVSLRSVPNPGYRNTPVDAPCPG